MEKSFKFQVSCDWSGSGRIQCYGHVSTDVTTPPGGEFLESGSVTCRPAEWVYESGLGPEAMFFKPNSGGEFEIWAVSILISLHFFFLFNPILLQWDYHEPNIPWAECTGDIWYMDNDMGAGFCTPNKGYGGCGYADCVGDIVCHGC